MPGNNRRGLKVLNPNKETSGALKRSVVIVDSEGLIKGHRISESGLKGLLENKLRQFEASRRAQIDFVNQYNDHPLKL